MVTLQLVTDAEPASGPDPLAAPRRVQDADAFAPLEWTVVALARRDRLASLGTPGRLARLVRALLGEGRSATLADPRLEALRRFAVHAWHRGYALPVSELKAFVAAGFSIDQAEAALARIAGERTTRVRQVASTAAYGAISRPSHANSRPDAVDGSPSITPSSRAAA